MISSGIMILLTINTLHHLQVHTSAMYYLTTRVMHQDLARLRLELIRFITMKSSSNEKESENQLGKELNLSSLLLLPIIINPHIPCRVCHPILTRLFPPGLSKCTLWAATVCNQPMVPFDPVARFVGSNRIRLQMMKLAPRLDDQLLLRAVPIRQVKLDTHGPLRMADWKIWC